MKSLESFKSRKFGSILKCNYSLWQCCDRHRIEHEGTNIVQLVQILNPTSEAGRTSRRGTMAGIFQTLSTYADNASNNLVQTFNQMTLEKWIRIVIIVGAYALLRPYIMKLGTRLQMRQYEKEAEVAEAEAAKKAQMSPNQLRGFAEIPDDTDDEGEGGGVTTQASTAADWGKKARRRQRQVIKKMIDVEEERLREAQADEEDKDIEEFLVPE
jgi:hypothetical protein